MRIFNSMKLGIAAIFVLGLISCEEEKDSFPVNRHGIYHTYEDGDGMPHRGQDLLTLTIVKSGSNFEVSGSTASSTGTNSYGFSFIIPQDATKGKHDLLTGDYELVYTQNSTDYIISEGFLKISSIEVDQSGDLVTLKSEFDATIEADIESPDNTYHTHTSGYLVILE